MTSMRISTLTLVVATCMIGLAAEGFAQTGAGGSGAGGGAGSRATGAASSPRSLSPSTPSGTAGRVAPGAGQMTPGSQVGTTPADPLAADQVPIGTPSLDATIPTPYPTVPQTGRGLPQVPSTANSPMNTQTPGGVTGAEGTGAPAPGGLTTGTIAGPQSSTGGSSSVPSTDPTNSPTDPTFSGTGVTPGATPGTSGDAAAGANSTGSGSAAAGAGNPIVPAPIDNSTGALGSSSVPTSASRTATNDTGGAAGATTEACMKTWDAGTHISKASWRAICKRSLREREQKAIEP